MTLKSRKRTIIEARARLEANNNEKIEPSVQFFWSGKLIRLKGDLFISRAEVAEGRGGGFEREPLRSPATSARDS